jgi:hypothetical protein
MTPRAARAKARADALAASITNSMPILSIAGANPEPAAANNLTDTKGKAAKRKSKHKNNHKNKNKTKLDAAATDNNNAASPGADATTAMAAPTTHETKQTVEAVSKSKKRKEKRLRKKKKDAEEALKRQRKIHFGTVSVREFQRQVGGGGGIPKLGGWSLGLGKVVRDIEVGSIDDMDQRKLEVKRKKVEEFRKTCSKSQRDTPVRKILKPYALKHNERERLFMRDLVQSNVFDRVPSFDSTTSGSFDRAGHSDSENASRAMAIPAAGAAVAAAATSSSSEQESKQPILSSSPVEFLLPGAFDHEPMRMHKGPSKNAKPSKQKRRRSRGRSRGNSGGSFNSTCSSRSRGSTGSVDSTASMGSMEGDAETRLRTESQELLSSMQAINQMIAEEDKKIMQSREDKRQGCNCTRGAMFSIISKIPENHVRDILKGHGKKPIEGSRKKLAKQYVSEIVDVCGLCLDNGCPCAKAGVECHDATCACIAEEEAAPPRKSGRTPVKHKPAAKTTKAKCQNPNGRYKYDDVGITTFRRGFLRRLGQKVDLSPTSSLARQRSPTAT